jgi:hypothetical protein
MSLIIFVLLIAIFLHILTAIAFNVFPFKILLIPVLSLRAAVFIIWHYFVPAVLNGWDKR